MSTPKNPSNFRRPWAAGVILLALTLVAFSPIFTGGFIWDDDDYVTNNANLTSAQGLWRIWFEPRSSPQYYPLVHTSFWIEQHLWGLHPAGYHVVNVILHAGAAVLLWRVLLLLEVPGAFLAACLFAIHPVQVESVAWITERKNVLSGLLYFAAALVYLKGSTVARASRPCEDRQRGQDVRATVALYLLSLLLFVCALLSKTVTCSLPAALLLILWWKRDRLTRREVLPLVPMFLLGIVLAATTVHLERDWVRATGPEWGFSVADRVLIAGRAVWFYVTKLLLPINLSFIYPKWLIDPHELWQWCFPLGVMVALVVLYLQRDRWSRGPIVGALIFVGTLVPALGFFNIYPMRYTFAADHYQYHAAAAILALAAAGLTRWIDRKGYIVLLPLLVLTVYRASIFRDAEFLWQDTLAKNPNSWMVNLNLARTLNARGEKSESWPIFARLVELAPDVPETHWNYGSALVQQGKIDQAIDQYTQAIHLGGDPLPQVYFLRGRLYRQQGKFNEAAVDFLSAIDHKPDMAEAWLELAGVYAQLGRAADARDAYRHAIQLDSSSK